MIKIKSNEIVAQSESGIESGIIKGIIFKYAQIKKSGKIKKYNGVSTKKDFITPLFEALGWNMCNKDKRDRLVCADEAIPKREVIVNGVTKN